MRETKNQKRARNPVRPKGEAGNLNTSKHAFTCPERADSISGASLPLRSRQTSRQGIVCGSLCKGGNSTPPTLHKQGSAPIGLKNKDCWKAIYKNRLCLVAAMLLPVQCLAFVWQIHVLPMQEMLMQWQCHTNVCFSSLLPLHTQCNGIR